VEQGLEVEAIARGSRLAGERAIDNGLEASPGDESGRLRIGRNPWTEIEPWTWLRDETSPRSRRWSKPSGGWESLRTERSGRPGSSCNEWTPSVMPRRGTEPPAGRLAPKGEGGRIDEETPKGRNGRRA
jgi:hypothetical protein